MKRNNYPEVDNELEVSKLNESEFVLADLDSDNGPITIFSEGDTEKTIFVSIGNTTIHIKESTFFVLTKAIQKSAKKILDL